MEHVAQSCAAERGLVICSVFRLDGEETHAKTSAHVWHMSDC